eukprot:g12304.t1
MEAFPQTATPPSLYLKPPAFDIELEEFGKLPLCRLEAIRLLREGVAAVNHIVPPDARALLLHGHGNRPSEAKHRRADLASHFILRLACCGGSSRVNAAAVEDAGQLDPTLTYEESKNRDKERREHEAGRRRDRREWFVRAERDLFKARLHWHLGRGEEGGTGGSAAAGEEHASRASRLDALLVVYELGWLQPVELPRTSRYGVEQMPERACFSEKGGGGGSSSGGGTGSASGGRVPVAGSRATGKRRRDGDDTFREEELAPPPAGTTTTAATGGGRRTTTTTAKTKLEEAIAGLRSSSALDNNGDSSVTYFSCPFEKVLPLVRSRHVLLRDGLALLSPVQVPEAVTEHFERRLREGLAVAERGLPGVEADERVREALRRVRSAIDTLVYGGGGGGEGKDNRSSAVITRSNIDQVAAKHFPLCMRRTLRILRREHHLKYQARLQFVSFLGNAGMEVGELLELWREEFPKGMPPDEYARKRNQYEYSLRHLYGMEGKRQAYSSQSCARIASLGWGGSGEGGSGHGCPFHSHPRIPGGGGGGGGGGGPNDTSVRGMLVAQKLPAVDIEDIVGPLESRGGGAAGPAGGGGGSCGGENGGGGGALGACHRHFSATHRWAAGGGSLWKAGGRGMQEASPNGWLAASTRSTQSQWQGQGQGQEPGQQAEAAAAAEQEEFLTQQVQGV